MGLKVSASVPLYPYTKSAIADAGFERMHSSSASASPVHCSWSMRPSAFVALVLESLERTRDESEVALRGVHALPALLRRKRRPRRADRAAHNGLVHVGVGVGVDGNTTGRVAPEGDAVRVAAEGRNVVFDPLRREANVLEAEVLLVERGAVGEAKDVDALGVFL